MRHGAAGGDPAGEEPDGPPAHRCWFHWNTSLLYVHTCAGSQQEVSRKSAGSEQNCSVGPRTEILKFSDTLKHYSTELHVSILSSRF